MTKLILDLCGGTGAWSRPYAEDGTYEVRIVDPVVDGRDVRLLKYLGEPVHGILAAPPCTVFSYANNFLPPRSGMELVDALSVVDACLRVILTHSPQWWALENPEGFLRRYLGPPVLKFGPWEFGDPWTKDTHLWGSFTPPQRDLVKPESLMTDRVRSPRKRAITPPGFAKAFKEANP